MPADILLLEDDTRYIKVVQNFFNTHQEAYPLRLHTANGIPTALAICRQHDVRVAIIDLLLPDGSTGTEAISAIWKFDKKIIFIVHTINSPQIVMEWSTGIGIPYTSQLFLQKSGVGKTAFVNDVARLHDLTLKALKSYVPHLPPSLVSVRETTQWIDSFSENHPSFRRQALISNMHHSQDVLNAVSQWASDRLARIGFDSTRVAGAMTGSFARLEATGLSDADYFVVFDDTGLKPDRLSDVMDVAYEAFTGIGDWFERNGIEVHQVHSDERKPGNIIWHSTVLPTWFPLSSFLRTPLGRSTQLEVTKQWFLLESLPIFNVPFLRKIEQMVVDKYGLSSNPTVRDAIAHSTLSESLQLLREEFDYAFRNRPRKSLATVKHFFMRSINLFSLRLWLLRCYLDPAIFNSPPEALFRELALHPLVRVVQFYLFLKKGGVVEQAGLDECLSHLEAICNLYAEAASAFASKSLRQIPENQEEHTMVNDLADSGGQCEKHISATLDLLRKARAISTHPELLRRIL